MKFDFISVCLRFLSLSGYLFVIAFLGACTCKQSVKHKKLAQNNYKLALEELNGTEIGLHAYKKSLGYLEAAARLNSKPEYRALQASVLFKLGQKQQSVKIFEELLQAELSDALRADVSNNLACVYAELGSHEKAQSLWESLLDNPHYLSPEVAQVNIGKLSFAQQNYAHARDCFASATRLCPSYIDAHFYQALVGAALHDAAAVREHAATVLYLEPNHQGAQALVQQYKAQASPPTIS